MTNNIVFVYQDRLIVTTSKGIYHGVPAHDDGDKRFRFVPETDINSALEGPEEPIEGRGIMAYAEDKLLLTTRGSTGIMSKKKDGGYTFDKRPLRTIDVADGVHADPDGVLWLSSSDGLYRYDPSVKKEYRPSYCAIIRSVATNLGRALFKGNYYDESSKSGEQYLDTQLDQPPSLVPTLEYEENGLTFEFSSLYFELIEHTEYQVWLEGFDKTWSSWSADTKKEYTNIAEGQYTFKVRAKNVYHHLSDVSEYRFVIKPPWYRTWPAYIAYGVLFLIILYLGTRLYARRLLVAKRRLEKIVRRRTAEVVEQKNEIAQQKDEIAAAHKALWGELALAKKIQTVLLPAAPKLPGFEIRALMQPADEVGGDYYDVFEIDGTYWIVIGDVSGHGVTAGLIMMMVQTSIHSVLAEASHQPPDRILASVNRIIYDNIQKLGGNRYMTITLMSVEPSGKLCFSGLHQDILIYRAEQQSVQTLATNGMWIGVMSDIEQVLQVDQLSLAPDDVMLVYTDGITEAANRDNSMFSIERLVEVFERHGAQPVADIERAILTALDEYECGDDITFIVVRKLATDTT